MVKPTDATYDGNLEVYSSWDVKKKKKKSLTVIVNILL